MLLLDTCSLLWLVGQQSSLTEVAKAALMKNSGSIFISAISAFEIGIKCHKGLLTLPMPVESWLQQAIKLHGLDTLSIDCEVAVRATQLPNLHRDPADRLIIATALIHHLSIVTPDQHIKSYPQVKIVW